MRNGAVPRMKNACRPSSGDVRISTPVWALEAAAAIGEEMAERIGATRVRVLGDPALLSAAPSSSPPLGLAQGAARIDPEAAAQALYGALAVVAAESVRATAIRSVHQTPSGELVRVLGHRILKRMKRR